MRTVSIGSHFSPRALTCPGARGGVFSSIIPFLMVAGTEAGTFFPQEDSDSRQTIAAINKTLRRVLIIIDI